MDLAKDDLRECYDGWLRLQPTLAGDVKVSFTINAGPDDTATVDDIALADSSLAHSWMEGCIVAAVREMRFAAPEDGEPLEVTYPLVFSTKERADGDAAPR